MEPSGPVAGQDAPLEGADAAPPSLRATEERGPCAPSVPVLGLQKTHPGEMGAATAEFFQEFCPGSARLPSFNTIPGDAEALPEHPRGAWGSPRGRGADRLAGEREGLGDNELRHQAHKVISGGEGITGQMQTARGGTHTD